jgi:RNA polymerase sigma factor FliA
MEKQKIQNIELWQKFKKEKKTSKKDKYKQELIEIYYPLVQKISFKVAKNLNWHLQPDELTSLGLDGLYSAVDRFSLDRGVDFPAYANRRISGSMIDAIRKDDFIPRSVRMKSSLMEKAKSEVEVEKGQAATEYEIVEKLGIDQREYLKNIKKYNPLGFISLNGSSISNNDKKDDFKQDFLTDLTDKNITPPDEEILEKEFLNKLISKSFSPLEQKIIYYYYYKNFTMGEIGVKLNTSESRISQIHSELLIRLKDKIQRNPKFFKEIVEKYIKQGDNDE